jgi:phosphomannomutase
VLELMSKKNMTLHDLLAPYRERYFISGEINTKLASMDEVPAKLAAIEAKYPDAQIAHIDGVSVDYPTWHFNVRASNTEPLLRLNLEAESPEMMEQKRDEVLAIIQGR